MTLAICTSALPPDVDVSFRSQIGGELVVDRPTSCIDGQHHSGPAVSRIAWLMPLEIDLPRTTALARCLCTTVVPSGLGFGSFWVEMLQRPLP
jgi:hypothetical protein